MKVKPEMGCGTAEDGMKRALFPSNSFFFVQEIDPLGNLKPFQIHLYLLKSYISDFVIKFNRSVRTIFLGRAQKPKDPVKLAEEIEEVPSVLMTDGEQLDLCQELHKAMPKKEVGQMIKFCL